MAAPIRDGEPREIIAGDSLAWRRQAPSSFPPATWTLTYALRLRNGTGEIDLTAAADGDAWLVSETAATTTPWDVGVYDWAAYADDGAGDRRRIDFGTIKIIENLAAVTGARDARSHVEKTLEAIEAVLEKTATKDQQSFQVDGESLDRRSFADLLLLRDRYKRLLTSEQQAEDVRRGTGSSGRRLQVRI